MEARRDAEVLALLDIIARIRTLQSFPWRCVMNSLEGRRGIAALIGAGMMGAIAFARGISPWIRTPHLALMPPDVEELTVPGLHNSGNNCFLNAILQALASSESFAAYLKAYNDAEVRPPLSSALSDLLQELAKVAPGHRIVSPWRVMSILSNYTQGFDLGMQQDAAEALTHLATALQKERMEDFDEQKPRLQSLADVSLQRQRIFPDQKENIPLECWTRKLRWPMEGTYGNMLACSKCGFQAPMQFDFFRDVALFLPQFLDGFVRTGCTIEECLNQFTTLERVSDFCCSRCCHLASACYLNTKPENKDILKIIQSCNYDDSCSCKSLMKERTGLWFNMHGDAYKCLRIGRCPEVLCLHLKRVMMNNAGQLKKIAGHVSFPMELDIFPFTIATQQAIRWKQLDTSQYVVVDPMKLLSGADLRAQIYTRAKCVGGADSGVVDVDKSEAHDVSDACQDNMVFTRPDCVGDADFGGDIEGDSQMEHCVGDAYSGGDTEGDSQMNHPDDPEAHPPQNYNTDRNGNRYKRQLYDLISVVVHHGGPNSGHYTVYRKVKVPHTGTQMLNATSTETTESCMDIMGKVGGTELETGGTEETMWFEISDADVAKVSEREVLAACATLLFYEVRREREI